MAGSTPASRSKASELLDSTLTTEQPVDAFTYVTVTHGVKLRLNDRIVARDLRRQGQSFSEIMSAIPKVSKGTLNGWLKDIELTKAQQARILAKIHSVADKGRIKGAFANRAKRVKTTKETLNVARNDATRRISDTFFVSGIMLYWAEGNKTREEIGFVNSDPIMIKFMMNWFRKVCNVQETKFRIALSIIAIHNQTETESFWSDVTEVPLTQFCKTRIKPTPLKGKRKPSYMGTCCIRIYDKNLFRKMEGWKSGVMNNFADAPIAQLDRANGF